MKSNSSDVFIIGGGINGAGIAADAAGRGLRVTLCEMRDLASATSSASSKLIHGGLRYLATYDFALVRKALQEREVLLRKAPHLIRPLEFILPHAKHLRPAWMIRLGLFIYDHLAAHPSLPNSSTVDCRQEPYASLLKSDITKGFRYYDCYDDDARLVIMNVIAAHQQQATILTHTQCVTAVYENDGWQLTLRDERTGHVFQHQATVLINAAGPWIQTVQESVIHESEKITVELIKGTHIVVPRLYDDNRAFILQNSDERVVFAIPFEKNFTLIGTTDVPYTRDLQQVNSTPEEENYLCETINRYFKRQLTASDIVWSYAGVRCLQSSDASRPSEITRDYKFEKSLRHPLITIISGKVTTYRSLSEEVVNSLRDYFPDLRPAWTANSLLPGGDLPNRDPLAYCQHLLAHYPWLPPAVAERYVQSYGTRCHFILDGAAAITDLGEHFGAGLYEKEVAYLCEQEWALTSDDILWRRTKLGLYFTTEQQEKLQKALSERFVYNRTQP